ncbi:unnamed protein product [Parajaminaea phylloscopi]
MASSQLLKSLVVPPASGQAPTATLIFAHGLGDTGLGWLDVAKMLSARPALRHVRFVLPNAPVQPVTLNMGMSMSSWFDITTLEDMEEGEDEYGLQKSAGEIKKLVQAEIDGTGDGLNGSTIAPERVVVGGFSQVRKLRGPMQTGWQPRMRGTACSRFYSSSSSSPSSLFSPAPVAKRPSAEALHTAASVAIADSGASVHGVGVDILHMPRLAALLARSRSANRFGRRILCRREQKEFAAMESQGASAQKLQSWLAVRWTAKEAAYKALYPSHRPIWSHLDVSKQTSLDGLGLKPSISFSDEHEAVSSSPAQLPQLHLSVSHDGEYVVSFVVAELSAGDGKHQGKAERTTSYSRDGGDDDRPKAPS